MTTMTADDFLAHHGVKGMKWGKRKGAGSSSETRTTSKDHDQVTKLRSKRPSEMSNEELRILTNRINLEQNYSRMNPSRVTKGRKLVTATIGTAGTAISVYNMAKSPAVKSAINLGKSLLDT